MRVEFSRRATRDLMRIADYIRPANPSAALKVRAAILAAIDTLALFPHVGRAQATGGVRKLVVRNYPYLVYFVVDGAADTVRIVTIRHAARKPAHRDR
jgi:toxin ParE1/3/4